MTTPKTNGNGAKEVTPATNNKPTAKQEPTAEELKAKTIKEQQEYFDGLAKLVSMRGRYQEHKEAVEEIAFEGANTEIFEHANSYGGKITLSDFSGNSYEIKNPKLIMELRNHLLSLFNSKIKDLEEGIFSYAEQKYTTK